MRHSASFHPERLSALIVDAGTHHRKLVAALLRGYGLTRVHPAESPTEVRAAVRRLDPSFIVLEWGLDKAVNACDIAREIRLDRELPNRAVPIIVVTVRASRVDVEAARNAGIDEYVVKPVSAAALLARIQEVVLRPRPFVDSATYVGPCRRRKQAVDYRGPFRRLTDPVDDFSADPQESSRKSRARELVQRLAEIARNVPPGDRARVRAVYTATREAEIGAMDIADDPLRRSFASLIRYLEGVGASDSLDPRVLDTHVEAMVQLVALPDAAVIMRERVAAGLETVVTKRLRETLLAKLQLEPTSDPPARGV